MDATTYSGAFVNYMNAFKKAAMYKNRKTVINAAANYGGPPLPDSPENLFAALNLKNKYDTRMEMLRKFYYNEKGKCYNGLYIKFDGPASTSMCFKDYDPTLTVPDPEDEPPTMKEMLTAARETYEFAATLAADCEILLLKNGKDNENVIKAYKAAETVYAF